jgi:hypothetical protein
MLVSGMAVAATGRITMMDMDEAAARGVVANDAVADTDSLGDDGLAITSREAWAVLHGMGLGALFLLAYTGGWVALVNLRRDRLTKTVLRSEMRPLKLWFWGMAIVSWLTAISGTVRVYPWYRGTPPPGSPPVTPPQSVLLADPKTAGWHRLGMEWKEHVAWIAPITSTAVAASVTYFGPELADRPRERQTLLAWYHLAFLTAAVAGVLGAFINKVASFNEGEQR